MMNSKVGTYVLVLKSKVFTQSEEATNVSIGRWGMLDIQSGFYLYIGSAFGSGGVRARVLRHFRQSKRKHWHIDYLREKLEPVKAFYTYNTQCREHQWASAIAKHDGIQMVKGFGCSDCSCYSHLFIAKQEPYASELSKLFGDEIHSIEFSKEYE